MELKARSLKRFIDELIAETFDYSDFAPLNHDTSRAKLKEAIAKPNPYWSHYEGDSFSRRNGIFFAVYGFEGDYAHIDIQVGESYFKITVTDRDSNNKIRSKLAEYRIQTAQIWINHQHLSDKLYEAVGKAIAFSNRYTLDEKVHEIEL